MEPIWKDYYVSLGSNTAGIQFRIKKSGTIIYTGKAFPVPGASAVSVRINDICADYLEKTNPFSGEDDVYKATFTIEAYSSGSWTQKDSVTFCRDWSYDYGFEYSASGPSVPPVKPIVQEVHPSAMLPVFSNGGSYSVKIYKKNGSSNTYSGTSDTGDVYLLDLSSYTNVDRVQANGLTYKAQNLCGGFVLYYINSLGGWDTIPIKGRAIPRLGYNRYTRDSDYNNRTASNRGRDNYVTEVSPSWTLTLGPLTASQAARIGELTGSTCVFLHDIESGKIWPVVLDDNKIEVKDRAGALHTYEITATLAQERIRR